MARQLRIEYAGAIYHVTVRSNGGERLFISDFDRKYLLSRIGETVERFRVCVYLYCLMSNHVHLVVETPQGNLGRFMQSVLTGYGVHFNRMHGRHGHITQGRYRARLVEGDEYLLKLSRRASESGEDGYHSVDVAGRTQRCFARVSMELISFLYRPESEKQVCGL